MKKQSLGLEKRWHALYTKPRWEKKVKDRLEAKGVECYCPVQKTVRQWSDRRKVILEPLFKSYVFVRMHKAESEKVKHTDGVLRFVYYNGQPAIIRDEEIEMIQNLLATKDVVLSSVSAEGFRPNDEVVITFGIFNKQRGVVVKGNKRKVVVKLESMGQYLRIEFPTQHLEPAR